MAEGIATPGNVPLVVDVDGTLVRGDLLHEAALQFVARTPLQSWRLATWLAGGKAALKAKLAERIDAADFLIPLRPETVDVIRQAQAEGRATYLASASDQRWVEPIAARVGGITGVLASDGTVNLAGDVKAARLVERFGLRGFDYIGDHRVDFPVWRAARGQLVVAHDAAFERAVKVEFPTAQTIARPRRSLRAHLRAIRPHQWAKNLLIFLPLIAGHSLFRLDQFAAAMVAFFAFSFAASSAYIINDLLDLPGDREHPRKGNRPFASGEVPATRGVAMTVVLMGVALLFAVLLPGRFTIVLGSYVTFTLAYSLVLKRRMLIDIIVLGGLYTLRVLGGVAATGQSVSTWLLMFSLFLFLSLAAVKRCSELVARGAAGVGAPAGRGYQNGDLAVLFPLAAAAGYGAVLVVTLYLSSSEVVRLYTHPARMWLICPLLLYWISRVLMLSNRNELHHDPVIYAFTDRISWATGVLVMLVIAVSL